MAFQIRPAEKNDFPQWAEMRHSLWREYTTAQHLADLEDLIPNLKLYGFVAESSKRLIGFSEASVRFFVNGCDTRPAAFLEGIWVEPSSRRQGVGLALLKAVESWATAQGFKELGSDTELENETSQLWHQAWGFTEMERTVNYRKILKP